MVLSGAKEESDGNRQNISAGADGVVELFRGFSDKEPASRTYLRLLEIVRPSLAEAITFVDKKVEMINDDSFGM